MNTQQKRQKWAKDIDKLVNGNHVLIPIELAEKLADELHFYDGETELYWEFNELINEVKEQA